MKALQAIYQNGQIDFLFTFPETQGPVNILVIFPEQDIPEQEEDPLFWEGWEEVKKQSSGNSF